LSGDPKPYSALKPGSGNGPLSATLAGPEKPTPDVRNLGDSCRVRDRWIVFSPLDYGSTVTEVEYDPRVINFRQLLEVFWTSHDCRQVFGQGPDVGNQYRSIIFTNGTEESRLAAHSKEREQMKSKSSIVTTQIQQLVAFYPAEPEHQVL
ncbi:hypothetical protein CUMW_182170, partial [Citrus unshiu]